MTTSDLDLEQWEAEHAEEASALRHERLVSGQLDLMRAADEAKLRFAAEKRGNITLPPKKRLDHFLAEPDEEVQFRIADVLPRDAHWLFTAQKKAGKTTTVANTLRSLADGDPFLGRHQVEKVDTIALLDNEMSESMLRRWLRAQGMLSASSVELVSLRGRVGSFNILDPVVRSAWASHLAGVDYVVFDCLRPVLDALGLDENKDGGRFITIFKELLGEAGVKESLIVHHMGHSGERARGDSSMEGSVDGWWRLVLEDKDNPASPRYFSGYGRDVDIPETMLGYDAATRRLTLGEGSRKDARSLALVDAVLAYVKANPGQSKTKIRDSVTGDSTEIGNAITMAVNDGLILGIPRTGRGGGVEYHPKP